jgi:hypothetical protein
MSLTITANRLPDGSNDDSMDVLVYDVLLVFVNSNDSVTRAVFSISRMGLGNDKFEVCTHEVDRNSLFW